MLAPELKDLLCNQATRLKKGEFISRAEALRRYNARNSQTWNNVDISGFYFALEHLQNLLDTIREHNEQNQGTNCEVKGIRIWEAKTMVALQNGQGQMEQGLIDDLLLVPVVADFSDFHCYMEGNDLKPNKPPVADTLLILSSSRPCPNLCGGGGVKFFYNYNAANPEKCCH
jgi:hypothetical protein